MKKKNLFLIHLPIYVTRSILFVYLILYVCVKYFPCIIDFYREVVSKVQIHNIEFFYKKIGLGKPLILINGFTNHTDMWDKMIPTLEKNFELILFDHRGSGRTDTTDPPYTIELLTHDLLSLMDALNISAAPMVGFSMGGAIIQNICLNHRDRIEKGILLASFSKIPPTAMIHMTNIAKLIQAGIPLAIVMESVLPLIYSNQYLSNPNRIKNTITNMINNPYPQSLKGHSGQLEALLSFDITNLLNQIQTEILIVHGSSDLFTPLYLAKNLKEKMQNAKLEIISDMGHMLPFECPDEMVKLIYAFCKN